MPFILTKGDSGLENLTSCICSFTTYETNCRQPVSFGVSSVLRCKLPLQILQFHAFMSFHLFGLHSPAISAVSVSPSHCIHMTEVCPLPDFLFDLPPDFFLTTCQIVCTCWTTLSTNTICPAFQRICVPAHLFSPDVSLTNKQLSSSAAYVCH